jgi:hypothetical protein
VIYEISRELGRAFATQGVPFPVVYGPELAATSAIRTRVVIMRGDEGSDSFEPPKSVHGNPQQRGSRMQGCVLQIYAQSTLSGAARQDHERLADHLLDQFYSEMDVIIQGRKNRWVMGPGGFKTPEDAGKSDPRNGVLYEAKFQISRGIARRTWAGEARPTVTITLVDSVTKVSTAGEPNEMGDPPLDAETL